MPVLGVVVVYTQVLLLAWQALYLLTLPPPLRPHYLTMTIRPTHQRAK